MPPPNARYLPHSRWAWLLSATLEKERDNSVATVFSRLTECPLVSCMHICAPVKKQANEFEVAARCRGIKRSIVVAVHVHCMHVRATVKQKSDMLKVAKVRRSKQRCAKVSRFDVRASIYEQVENCQIATLV